MCVLFPPRVFRPGLKAPSNRYLIKAEGKKKDELLCGCLATCYFRVTTAIMLMQLHRAAATNHSPKTLPSTRDVWGRATDHNSAEFLPLSAGVPPWIMTQTFPPRASSSLSTMRLAQLCFAPSKGNEVLEAAGLIGQDGLRFYDLILPFFFPLS